MTEANRCIHILLQNQRYAQRYTSGDQRVRGAGCSTVGAQSIYAALNQHRLQRVASITSAKSTFTTTAYGEHSSPLRHGKIQTSETDRVGRVVDESHLQLGLPPIMSSVSVFAGLVTRTWSVSTSEGVKQITLTHHTVTGGDFRAYPFSVCAASSQRDSVRRLQVNAFSQSTLVMFQAQKA